MATAISDDYYIIKPNDIIFMTIYPGSECIEKWIDSDFVIFDNYTPTNHHPNVGINLLQIDEGIFKFKIIDYA